MTTVESTAVLLIIFAVCAAIYVWWPVSAIVAVLFGIYVIRTGGKRP